MTINPYLTPLDTLASYHHPVSYMRQLPKIIAILASAVSSVALIVFEGKKYLFGQECTPGMRDPFTVLECNQKGKWVEGMETVYFNDYKLRATACHYGMPMPGCVEGRYYHHLSVECTDRKYNHHRRKEVCDPKDSPYDGLDEGMFITETRVIACKQGKDGIEGCDGKGNYYTVREERDYKKNWRSFINGEGQPAFLKLAPETDKFIAQWLADDKYKDQWGPLL